MSGIASVCAGYNFFDDCSPTSSNHHYNANLIGGAARFKKITLEGPDDPRAAELLKHSHGVLNYDQPHYVVEHVDKSVSASRASKFITSGNGESIVGLPPPPLSFADVAH